MNEPDESHGALAVLDLRDDPGRLIDAIREYVLNQAGPVEVRAGRRPEGRPQAGWREEAPR